MVYLAINYSKIMYSQNTFMRDFLLNATTDLTRKMEVILTYVLKHKFGLDVSPQLAATRLTKVRYIDDENWTYFYLDLDKHKEKVKDDILYSESYVCRFERAEGGHNDYEITPLPIQENGYKFTLSQRFHAAIPIPQDLLK